VLKNLQGPSDIVVVIQFDVEEPDLALLERSGPYRVRWLGLVAVWCGLSFALASERRKEVTKYCPESSSHGEVLVAAADLACVRCGLLRRLRSRRACVIESRTVGGRRMKRTPACSECWKVCLTVCTQLKSPSLHSLGHDGSAPLRPEAQTCPQTRSLMG
jgi:hypothetical protein